MGDIVSKELQEKTGEKAKFGDIAKLTSAKWNSLSEDERKEWEDKAAVDKQRYDSEMEVFLQGKDPAGALRAKYQHMIPMKPQSPFNLFCRDAAVREKAVAALKSESKEANEKTMRAKLGEMWKCSTVSEKVIFQEQHVKDNLEYLDKQKVWQATPEFAELEKANKEQEVFKQAVEAALAAEKAARLEREARELRLAKAANKRKATQVTKDTTPAKKGRNSSAPTSTPEAKGSRGRSALPPQGPVLDEKVVVEAAKCGLESSLRNLASRPEVMSSGKSARAILDALRSCNGLVNPAKRALLGH